MKISIQPLEQGRLQVTINPEDGISLKPSGKRRRYRHWRRMPRRRLRDTFRSTRLLAITEFTGDNTFIVSYDTADNALESAKAAGRVLEDIFHSYQPAITIGLQ